jgi:hypothetical protein
MTNDQLPPRYCQFGKRFLDGLSWLAPVLRTKVRRFARKRIESHLDLAPVGDISVSIASLTRLMKAQTNPNPARSGAFSLFVP